jgi:hypothetical protein
MNYYITEIVLSIVILIVGWAIVSTIIYPKNPSENNSEKFESDFASANIGDVQQFKNQYYEMPNSTQPNIDYQDYLDNSSGYNSATRGYNNPHYAKSVAAGLTTN